MINSPCRLTLKPYYELIIKFEHILVLSADYRYNAGRIYWSFSEKKKTRKKTPFAAF